MSSHKIDTSSERFVLESISLRAIWITALLPERPVVPAVPVAPLVPVAPVVPVWYLEVVDVAPPIPDVAPPTPDPLLYPL